MSTTRRVPWARILTEGLVIVVSILLAFGLQAWWEQRQERLAETDALTRLASEFVAVDSVMRAWQDRHRRTFDAGEALLALTGPSTAEPLGADSLGVLLGMVESTWTLDPPGGVLSSLITSGRLNLIRNQELQAALVSHQGLLDDVHGDEVFALRHVSDQLGPYLDQRVAYRTVVALRNDYRTTSSRFSDGFQALLSDRHFENLIEARVANTYWALRSYQEALDGVARIRLLIQQELST